MTSEQDRAQIAEKINIGSEVLYLTKEECETCGISMATILDLTRSALIAHGKKEYEMPAKIGVHPLEEVFYHAMPAYVPNQQAVGMKWIECYPNNPERFGLPQTTGLMIMNDVLSGCPLAIMDSAWITAMRTPAVTVLAAQALHPKAVTFGMFGCGVQGTQHVRFAGKALPSLKKIYLYDVNPDRMDSLIAVVQGEVEAEIIKCDSPQQVAVSCEIMSSATLIIREPQCVVKDEWVSAGQTILPCDLNTFWDPQIPKRAHKYIVDSREEHELFGRMGYFPGGMPQITCETGEVLAGVKPGRMSGDELIVCSNIGMSVCDVVMGRAVMDIALTNGLGRKLPL